MKLFRIKHFLITFHVLDILLYMLYVICYFPWLYFLIVCVCMCVCGCIGECVYISVFQITMRRKLIPNYFFSGRGLGWEVRTKSQRPSIHADSAHDKAQSCDFKFFEKKIITTIIQSCKYLHEICKIQL